MKLAVNEIFGPTVQGEGPSMGRQAVFLRLALCNLKCSWCDTKYTWDWKGEFGVAYKRADEIHLLDIKRVLDGLYDHLPEDYLVKPLLVVSGGEPMLQSKGLLELIELLPNRFVGDVEIETNGTIEPFDSSLGAYVTFNVSPKLGNSGNPWPKRMLSDYYVKEAPRARFKFVVTCVEDLDEVELLIYAYGIENYKVWIMPEGTQDFALNTRLAALADEAIVRGWNLTTRMHVLLWGNRRAI